MKHSGKIYEVHSTMHRMRFPIISSFVVVLLAVGCTTDPAKKKAQFVASAEKYYQQRQYTDAEIQYRNALKIDPRSADLHYELGLTLFANQQYRESVLEYQRARELNPNYAPAQIALGQIALLSNQFDEADKLSSQILAKDPSNKEAVILHATALAAKKDFDGAQRALGDLIASYPDYAPAYLDRGTFLSLQGKRDEARQSYEAGLKADPKSIALHRALAGSYLQQGDAQSAERQLQAAVQSNPDSAEARQTLAAFYVAQKRATDAEKVFQDLITLQKHSPESKFQLASFYLSQGRSGDAKRLDAEIAKAKPEYVPARLQLVAIALDEQAPAEADRLMKDLIHDRPKDPQVLMTDANMKMKTGEAQKALQDLDAVQKLDPRAPSVHYLRGLAQRQLGSNEQAEAEFTQAISIDGKYLEPRLALAQLQMDRGKFDDALGTAQQALAINDRAPMALLIAGNAYAVKGDLKSAEAQYEKLEAAAPNSAEPIMRMGYIHMAEHRMDDAQKEFERALSLSPQQVEAVQGLVTVYHARKNDAKAMSVIRDQINNKPTAALYNLLASAQMEFGNRADAENTLQESLKLDSKNLATYSLLGSYYASQHAIPKAIEQYEQAARISPSSVALWTTIGMLQEQAGDYAAATKAYNSALSIDPNAGVAANNLAWLISDKGGDKDRALELAQRAKQAMPDSPSVDDTLGWIYYQRGLYSTSAPLLQDAIAKDPKHANYHVHLAAVLLASGKKDKAKTELDTALRLDASVRDKDQVKNLIAKF